MALASFAWSAGAAADEIKAAVAANFATTMEALTARFEASTSHTVLVSTGSTGAHYAQIRNGAPFDVFLAADAERPMLLEQEGVAVADSRFTYAVGRLALWSRLPELVDDAGRVLEADTFRHVAIANPATAPYGRAAREVLENLGLWSTLQGRIVQGQDVGQAFGYVYSGNAELGFVALSQVRSPGRESEGSAWLVPPSLYSPIEQQAVALNDGEAVRAFLDFLRGDEAREIMRAYGYGP